MEAFPLVGLELPLKMLVWEESGDVNVAYEKPSEFAARFGVIGMDQRLEMMDKAMAALAAIVAHDG